MTPQYVNDVREVLCDFMRRMNITYPKVTYDSEFAQSCCEVALRDDFLPGIVESPDFQLALHGAVAIATTTFAHLENISTRQYICLYTTCLIYFDDLTKTDASSVREFHTRFVSGRSQMHPLLDSYATLLRKAWEHFLPPCANLVVSSSLDFINGLIVDHDQQQMTVNACATSYPRWVRTMMGVSTAFVVFTFPPDVPLASYIQIFPNMVSYIDDVNDLFSFYKEEAIHEGTNHISLLAQLSGKSKLQCMKELAEYSIDGSHRCQTVLSADQKALETYTQHFLPGYVAFHAAASKRYKLDDLHLG
ncbi:terpenoid synthase [Athelia psychrophila]|uniref:Terpenoid synthase n=1 Tax=Athelia psychrophila TaxID=1759441 RepID=A0A166SUR9_9AGAM|nr:terpenoid synthase [Fibularhizoctonia sp. CBS 109695]